mgnify:CR=1 FL=1
MTVQALTDLDVAFGWDSNETSFADLKSVVQELQGIQLTVCSGQLNAGVAMTVSGIVSTDTILAAWEVNTGSPTGSNLINRTASTAVTASGYVACNEGLGAASVFLVLWFDKSGR